MSYDNYAKYLAFKTAQSSLATEFVNVTGDSMAGSLNMHNNDIYNVKNLSVFEGGQLIFNDGLQIDSDIINQIKAIQFSDGTYLGEGSSFDISTNQLLHLKTSDRVLVEGNTSFKDNVVIEGKLITKGATTQVNTEDLVIKDNLIIINQTLDENRKTDPSGVLADPFDFQSGFVVYRGPDASGNPVRDPYQFLYDEVTNTFRVGTVNEMQPVATREDAPIHNAVAVWDSSLNKFVTNPNFVLDASGNNVTEGLTVLGDAKMNDVKVRNLDVSENLVVSGETILLKADISENLLVKGDTFVNDVNAVNMDLSGTLDVRGSSHFSNITTSHTDVCGNLTVDGNTTVKNMEAENIELNENLLVKGDTVVNDVNAKNVDISENLLVKGDTVVNDVNAKNVDISENLVVKGDTVLENVNVKNLDISGDVVLDGELTVEKEVSIKSDLDINCNIIKDVSNIEFCNSRNYIQDIETLDISVNVLEDRTDSLDASVNVLEGRADSLDVSVNVLEGRADGFDTSLNSLDVSVNILEGRADGFDTSLNSLDDLKFDKVGGLISGSVQIDGNLGLQCNDISNVNRVFFCDDSSIGVGNSLDISSNGLLTLRSNDSVLIKSNAVVKQNLDVLGNLNIKGTTTQVSTEDLVIKDNLIVINQAMDASGNVDLSGVVFEPNSFESGFVVFRGTDPNSGDPTAVRTPYQFLYSEETNTFNVGISGEMQPVATREFAPSTDGVAVWNSTEFKFDTNRGVNIDTSGNMSVQGTVDIEKTLTAKSSLAMNDTEITQVSNIQFSDTTNYLDTRTAIDTSLNVLEGRADGFDASLNSLDVSMNVMEGRADGFDASLNSLDVSMNVMEGRADGFDASLNSLDVSMNVMEGRADGFDVSLNSLDVSMNVMEGRADGFDTSLNSLDVSMNVMEGRADGFDVSLNSLDNLKYDKTGGLIDGSVQIDGVLNMSSQNIENVHSIKFIGDTVINNGDSFDISSNKKVKVRSSEDVVLDANTVIKQNLDILGNLHIKGTTTQVSTQDLVIKDNLIVINQTMDASGNVDLSGELLDPNGFESGFVVFRGTDPNSGDPTVVRDPFQFLYSEDTMTFNVGVSGDMQPVATREFTPTTDGIAVWKEEENRFVTERGITVDSSGNMMVSGEVSIQSDLTMNDKVMKQVSNIEFTNSRNYLDDIETLDVSVNVLEGRADGFDASLNSLDVSMNIIEGRVDSLDVSVNVLEGRADGFDTSLNSLDISVNILENRADGFDLSLNSLDVSMNVIEGRADILDISVNILEGRADGFDTSLNSLDVSMNVMEGRADGFDTSLNSLDVSMNVMEGRADGFDASLNSLDVSMNVIEGRADGLDVSVNSLDNLKFDKVGGVITGEVTMEGDLKMTDTDISGVNKITFSDGSFITIGNSLNLNGVLSIQKSENGAEERSTTFNKSLVVKENLDILGNLNVQGSTTQISTQELVIKDNLIVINQTMDASGNVDLSGEHLDPTGFESGFVVYRGVNSSDDPTKVRTPYQFLYSEDTNTFNVGISGEMQPVATREFAPSTDGVAVWNSTDFKFDTMRGVTVDTSGNMSIQGELSIHSDVTLNSQRVIDVSDITFVDGTAYIETRDIQDLSINILENRVDSVDVSLNILEGRADGFDVSLNSLDISMNVMEGRADMKDMSVNILEERADGFDVSLNSLDVSMNLMEGRADGFDVSLNSLDDLKYDKTGGLVNGNVDISGNLEFYSTDISSVAFLGSGSITDLSDNTYDTFDISTNKVLQVKSSDFVLVDSNTIFTKCVDIIGTASNSSDQRIKRNEQEITNAVDVFMKMKPKVYEKLHMSMDGVIHEDKAVKESGLIAQEIYYDTPELRYLVKPASDAKDIEEAPPSYKEGEKQDWSNWGSRPATVNYIGLIPHLIQAVKELNTKHQELQQKYDEQSEELNLLKKKLQ